MIYLCDDSNKVGAILNGDFGLDAIRYTILLNFKAYGTAYEFAQYYIQRSDEYNIDTALVMRYNHTVYILSTLECDLSELSSFVGGFTDCELIYDGFAGALNFTYESMSAGAVMCAKGKSVDVQNFSVLLVNEPKPISELVGENMSSDKRTDFFLNTAHQMRHNLLRVYGVISDSRPVSAVSLFDVDSKHSLIHFVYTGEHFRGNGYSSDIIRSVCSDISVDYILLCEEHNIKFYEKCGFAQVSSWIHYRS